MINREELWRRTIEAGGNARYYGCMQGICRWADTGVKAILLVSTVGSIVTVFSGNTVALICTISAFTAALAEVVLKPLLKWNEVFEEARNLKERWIDVRNQYEELWREMESRHLAVICAKDVLAKDAAVEKTRSKTHVFQLQWLVNRHMKAADEAMTRDWT